MSDEACCEACRLFATPNPNNQSPSSASEPLELRTRGLIITVTEKGGSPQALHFQREEIVIGRVQGNDIILPKGNVSKRATRLSLVGNRVVVVDLKSTCGTYVNNRRITSPQELHQGDKIYIGDFMLTVEATLS
jgi:pSer/pThr/pTyr-binding forkhead associated (FHA) protein